MTSICSYVAVQIGIFKCGTNPVIKKFCFSCSGGRFPPVTNRDPPSRRHDNALSDYCSSCSGMCPQALNSRDLCFSNFLYNFVQFPPFFFFFSGAHQSLPDDDTWAILLPSIPMPNSIWTSWRSDRCASPTFEFLYFSVSFSRVFPHSLYHLLPVFLSQCCCIIEWSRVNHFPIQVRLAVMSIASI